MNTYDCPGGTIGKARAGRGRASHGLDLRPADQTGPDARSVVPVLGRLMAGVDPQAGDRRVTTGRRAAPVNASPWRRGCPPCPSGGCSRRRRPLASIARSIVARHPAVDSHRRRCSGLVPRRRGSHQGGLGRRGGCDDRRPACPHDDWIDQLYVDPECTGKGLGTRLVDVAKASRPGGLQLWTFQANHRARCFYERHGFTSAEATQGDNEEGAPDVRYEWRPSDRAGLVS